MLITPDQVRLGDDVNVAEADVQAEIRAVVARAAVFAPCVTAAGVLAGDLEEAARGVLVDVIARRVRTRDLVPGTSGSVTAGGRTESTDTKDLRVLFWPNEVAELQSICAAATSAAVAVVAPAYSFPEQCGRFPDPAEPERRFPQW